MNTVGNARAAESKTRIREAFLQLLAQKDLAKISVREVCDNAQINRSTFYKHYLDANDLLEKIEADLMEPIAFDRIYPADVDVQVAFTAAELMPMLRYFRENKTFYRMYFSTSLESGMLQKSAQMMQTHIIAPYWRKKGDFTAAEMPYQYEFCKAGFVGVLQRWLHHDCDESDETMATLLEKVLLRCIA